jgi:hypothetical protein
VAVRCRPREFRALHTGRLPTGRYAAITAVGRSAASTPAPFADLRALPNVAVAAVMGRPEVMAVLESGRASRAGTYSGNPLACEAVVATLAELDGQDYPALLARRDALRRRIEPVFSDAGLSLSASGYGSVFTLWPSAVTPRNYADAVATMRSEFSESLHHAMRNLGVLLMPMPLGRVYLSFAHDSACLNEIAAAFAYSSYGDSVPMPPTQVHTVLRRYRAVGIAFARR